MEWREIAVTVSSQGEEMVADLFYQLGCPGVSIESPELLQSYIESGVWDDHAFCEIEGLGTAIVKGYFPVDDELGAKIARLENGLKQLLAQFPDWVVKVTGTSLNEEDWATAWKAYYKPLRVGRNFLVKPTWEEAGADPGVIVIELDPGMAFGTGTHPTTVLCLCALEDVVRTGQKVYDVGTGSGILAIAAAKLGATVDAVDCDPVAVQAAKDNVALNQVSDRVRVHRGDLATALNGEADIVVANITADAIIALLPDLRRILKRDGEFLASGIIVQRAEEVRQKMDEVGLAVVEQREDAGWVLLRARWTSNASL